MKKITLLTLALIITTLGFSQYKELKELPSNFLSEPVMLTTSLDDETFEFASEKIKGDLKLLGINVVTIYNMSKNLTKAAKQRKEMEAIMKDYKVKNVIGVNFLTFTFVRKRSARASDVTYVWGELVQKEKAYITVTNSTTMNSKAKPEIYMIKKNDYPKALKVLEKQIQSQFNSK